MLRIMIFECKIILNLLREESKERNQEIIFLKYEIMNYSEFKL